MTNTSVLSGISSNRSVGILIQNRAGGILSADSRAMSVLGLKTSEGPLSDPFDGAVREDLTAISPLERPLALACLTGEPSPPVKMGIQVPGTPGVKWIQAASTPLFSSGSMEIGQVVTTISESTQSPGIDEAWPEGRGALKALIDVIPGVAYRFLVAPNGSWRFLYLSEGIVGLYGVTPEEGLKDHNALTSRILEIDRESHRASVEDAVRNLRYWTHEHRISGPDGQIKWVKGHARPRQMADGSVLWTGVLLDITLSKQFETALVQARLKSEELHANLASIFQGPPPVDTGFLGASPQQLLHENLSRREVEVLRMVALGRTIREISEKLSLSSKTVATYRARIATKLNLTTNIELTRYAIKHRLIEP